MSVMKIPVEGNQILMKLYTGTSNEEDIQRSVEIFEKISSETIDNKNRYSKSQHKTELKNMVLLGEWLGDYVTNFGYTKDGNIGKSYARRIEGKKNRAEVVLHNYEVGSR